MDSPVSLKGKMMASFSLLYSHSPLSMCPLEISPELPKLGQKDGYIAGLYCLFYTCAASRVLVNIKERQIQ